MFKRKTQSHWFKKGKEEQQNKRQTTLSFFEKKLENTPLSASSSPSPSTSTSFSVKMSQSSLSFKPLNSLQANQLCLKKEEYTPQAKEWLKDFPLAQKEIEQILPSSSETIKIGDDFEWKVTSEQKMIIDNPVFHTPLSPGTFKSDISVAGAGCGKTHTLIPLVKKHTSKKFLYLAFNNSIVKEARTKMKNYNIENVEIYTFSGFAYKIKVLEQDFSFCEDEYEWQNIICETFLKRRRTRIPKEMMFSITQAFERFCRSSDLQVLDKHVSMQPKQQQQFVNYQEIKKRKQMLQSIQEERKKEQDSIYQEASPKQLKQIIEVLWKWSKEKIIPLSFVSLTKLLQCDKEKDQLHQRYDVCLVDETQDLIDVVLDVLLIPWILQCIGDVCQTVNEWAGVNNPIQKIPFSNMFYLTESFRFSHSVSLFFNLSAQLVGVQNMPLIRPLKGCSPHKTDIRPFSFLNSQKKCRSWKSVSSFFKECMGKELPLVGILSRNNLDLFNLLLSPTIFQWIRKGEIHVILQDSLCLYLLEMLKIFLMSETEKEETLQMAILFDQYHLKKKIEFTHTMKQNAGVICRQIRFLLLSRFEQHRSEQLEGDVKIQLPPIHPIEREWGKNVSSSSSNLDVSLEEIEAFSSEEKKEKDPHKTSPPQFFFSTIHTSKGMEFPGVVLLDNISSLIFRAACLKESDFLECRNLSLNSTLKWVEQEIMRSRTRKPSFSDMCLFTVAITRAINCLCLPPFLYDLFQALVIFDTENRRKKEEEKENLKKLFLLDDPPE